MADRTLNVRVSGDVTGLGRSFQKASKQSESFGSKMQRHVVGVFHEVGKAAEYAGGIIGISFAGALVDGIKVAANNQVAVEKLRKSVENSGLSWKKYGDRVQESQDKLAGLSGFTNTDLESSLATLVTTTGKVSSAQKLQAEAMDLSRARGMSLSQASVILSKVWSGNTTSLQRLGISIGKSTKNYDAYMASTKHATAAGKAHAKELDMIANRQGALTQLQQKFGGASKAYANTASGALARIRASADILLERLGKVLLPYLNRFAAWFAEHLPEIQRDGGRVFGALRDVIVQIADAVKYAIGFYQRWSTWIQAAGVFVATLVGGFEAYLAVQKLILVATKIWTAAQIVLNAAMDANPIGIAVVAAAALAAGFVILWKRSSTFRDIVKKAFHDIQIAVGAVTDFIRQHWGSVTSFVESAARHVWQVVGPIIGYIHDHWKTLLAFMTGGTSTAVQFVVNHWGTIKNVAQRVITFVINRWGNIKSAISSFAGWVNKYVIGPIQSIISWAKRAIGWISKLNPFGGGDKVGGLQASAEQKYAASQLGKYGWGPNQMAPLISLWNAESGWNPNSVNAKSGAEGIPQLLPSSHTVPPGFPTTPPVSPVAQINWGLGYIHGAYPGGPADAWAKWQARSPHWYDSGGVVPGPRGVHRPAWVAGGETILPTHKRGFSAGNHVHVYIGSILAGTEAQVETFVRRAVISALRHHGPNAFKSTTGAQLA